jgi:hypothetical protein
MLVGSIRPVTLEDLPRIARLVAQCGFPERSPEGWRWVLFENPDQGNSAPGWVYEHQGQLAGFLGNFVMSYRHGPDRFQIASGHTVVTDMRRPQLHAGVRLIRHGLSQPGVHGFGSLNNNALSAPLLPRLGAPPRYGRAGREWAEWVLRPERLIQHRLRLGSQPSDRSFDIDFSGREQAGRIELRPLEDFYDDALKAIQPGTWLTREIDLARLRWRLADPDRTGGAGYRIAAVGGVPLAIGALVVTQPGPDRLEHAEITDWIATDDGHGLAAQRALMSHLWRLAKAAGVARLRLKFPRHLQPAALRAAGPFLMRRHGHHPCHFQFRETALLNWRPAPGDADFFFAYRILPTHYKGASAR